MKNDMILPPGVRELIGGDISSRWHPGLQLDKYSPPGDQAGQKEAIDIVCKAKGDSDVLNTLHERRDWILQETTTLRFRAETIGPLTLHLARASGLENAGIHLHPVYGFACLPGSGLKGMARAYAKTVWLPGQADEGAAHKLICDVFGWSKRESSHAGGVVFHDAWPKTWPQLETDILNSHHSKYYRGECDPGDWESPIPVYFIVIAEGTIFDFALSSGAEGNDKLVSQASEWLQAALVHEGAGAKTNSGYGRFKLEDLPAPTIPNEEVRQVAVHEVKLATPGFLAGANQRKADCDLRPATVRGQLRWWWRTMHAGHLKRTDLLCLETAIWGSARHGAALALSIRPIGRPAVALFDYKDGFRPKTDFAKAHGLERPERGKKTTQGLFYVSYGMDEMSRGQRRQRWYVEPGASWAITLSARRGHLPEWRIPITAADVLRQGEAALWLLCRFGAVGSKARRGFGSFDDINIKNFTSIKDCKDVAQEFRNACKFRSGGGVSTASLEKMIEFESAVVTPWSDPWFAMDQVGFAYQEAVKSFPASERGELGLPRKTGRGPASGLGAAQIDRLASPMHWSLSRDSGGKNLMVRVLAFSPARSPGRETRPSIVEEAVKKAESNLKLRIQRHRSGGSGSSALAGRIGVHPVRDGAAVDSSPTLPPNGTSVCVELLEEKTKRGAWKARHLESKFVGVIENHKEMPSDVEPGQRVELLVVNRTNFLWPTEEARARFMKAKSQSRRLPPRRRR